MTFWTFVLVGGILLWISVGRLVNSDSKSGELFRLMIGALIERVSGRRKPDDVELQPQPPEVIYDDGESKPKPKRFGGA